MQRIASLNSDAVFTKKVNDAGVDEGVLKWETKGDASESAIIKFVQPLRDIIDYRYGGAACGLFFVGGVCV